MTRRIILGANLTAYAAGYGLWVSKPTKDVTSTTLTDFLVAPGINNTQNIISGILASGTVLDRISEGTSVNISLDAFGDYETVVPCVYGVYVTHGLGYVPMVWTDLKPGYYYTEPDPSGIGTFYYGTDGRFNPYWMVYADSTKVGLECHGGVISYQDFNGSNQTQAVPTQISTNKAFHYSVMGVQVA